MKKSIWALFLGLILIMVLTGCGEKTQEDILEDLNTKLSDMTSYEANATMVLQTGEDPQQYEVDIAHQKEDYYRVALTNEKKNQSQIILRNDDGVFVLTPALNKSFRFQSDWPKNNSQVYLYESLLRDILMDPERKFEVSDNHYIFNTITNYQNKNLHSQEITLNKKDLSPVTVKIMNQDMNVLVQLDFHSFDWNPTFGDDYFDMERNMTAAQIDDVPTIAEIEETGPLTPLYPMYEPEGTSFKESKTIKSEDGEKVVLTYGGDRSFTIIQQKAQVVPASTPMNLRSGEPVDLGFTVGVLSTDSLMWTHKGVDFYLASNDLSEEDMVDVARSVYGTLEK